MLIMHANDIHKMGTGNEKPTVDDIKKILDSIGSECDAELAGNLVSELEGKEVHEVFPCENTSGWGFGWV